MIKSLQSLRFFFAVLIFLHHSAINWPAFGSFPVSFFLILSGFILMRGYGDRVCQMSFFTFFIKRMRRIYPTHLLCLVIALIVSLYIEKPINWLNTLPSFFVLQAWVPVQDVYFAGNSVAWYVSVCTFCYALFPFLAKVVKRNPMVVMLFSVGIYLTACLLVPLGFQHPILYINPLFRLVDFILGMWLYEMINKKQVENYMNKILDKSSTSKFFIESLPFILGLLAIVASLNMGNVFMLAAFWWAPSLIIIFIFYFLDSSPGFITRLLHHSFFVTLGSISYAFYMLHISILIINNYFMEIYPINYVLDGLVVLTIIVVIAYIVTYYYEPLFKKSNKTYNEKI